MTTDPRAKPSYRIADDPDQTALEAKRLEADVHASIARDRAEEAYRQSEMAAHHIAVSMAKKPIARTFKPFANLKELLV